MIKVYVVYQAKDWIIPYWTVSETSLVGWPLNSIHGQVTINDEIINISRDMVFTDLNAAVLDCDRRNLNDDQLRELYEQICIILKR